MHYLSSIIVSHFYFSLSSLVKMHISLFFIILFILYKFHICIDKSILIFNLLKPRLNLYGDVFSCDKDGGFRYTSKAIITFLLLDLIKKCYKIKLK